MGGKTKLPLVLPTPTAEKTMLFHTPQKEVGFAVTLTASRHSSSGKSVSRVVPLDIDFAQQKIGKGAFARSVSIVYSQLKYWWRYAKWKYNNKTWFYKSQRELSDELGMSEKTIWRCIKQKKSLRGQTNTDRQGEVSVSAKRIHSQTINSILVGIVGVAD